MATDSEKFIDRFAVVVEMDRFAVVVEMDRFAVVEDSDWFAVELPVWGLPLNSPAGRSSEESRGSESENEPVSGLSMDKVARGIALILTYAATSGGITSFENEIEQ
jgi:hypothetical protein